MKKRAVTDYAVPPGATLLETIEALGISQTDLAARTGETKEDQTK